MAVAYLSHGQSNDLTSVYDEIEACWEYEIQGENLLKASRSGQLHWVQEILARYPHLDVVDHAGKSALMHACEGGQEQVAWTLLSRGCNVDLTDDQHRSALTYAVSAGQTGIVFDLCLKKAELNRQDKQGNCLLHYATGKGAKDIVKILLIFGADVGCHDADGRTPLHMAVSRNLLEIVEALLQWKAPLEVKDNYNMTPLYLANKNARCKEILHKYRKKESPFQPNSDIFSQWRKDLDTYFRRVHSRTTAVPLAQYDQLDGFVLTRSATKPSQQKSTKQKSIHNAATSSHQENNVKQATTVRKSSIQLDTADCCLYCNDRDDYPDLPVPEEDAPKCPPFLLVSNGKHDFQNLAEDDDEELHEKTDENEIRNEVSQNYVEIYEESQDNVERIEASLGNVERSEASLDNVERNEASLDNVERSEASLDNVYRNLMPPSLPPRRSQVNPSSQPSVEVSSQSHVTGRHSIVQNLIATSTPARRHEPLRRCGFPRAEWNQQVTTEPAEIPSGQPSQISPGMKTLISKTTLERPSQRPVETRQNETDLSALLSLQPTDQLQDASCPSPARSYNSTQTSFRYNPRSHPPSAHRPLGQTRSDSAVVEVIRSIESRGSDENIIPHIYWDSEDGTMPTGDRGFTRKYQTPRPSQRKKLPLQQSASAEPRLETLQISKNLPIDVEKCTNIYKDEKTNTGESEHLSGNSNKQQSNQSFSKSSSVNHALEIKRHMDKSQGEIPCAPRPMQRKHQHLVYTVSADSFLWGDRTVSLGMETPPTPKKRQHVPAVKSLSTGNPARNPVCRTDHLYEWSRCSETEDPSTFNEKTSSEGPHNQFTEGPPNTSSHTCGSGSPCANSHVLLLKNSNKNYFNITEVNIKKADNLVVRGRISVRREQSDDSTDSDDHSDHSMDSTQENSCSQQQQYVYV